MLFGLSISIAIFSVAQIVKLLQSPRLWWAQGNVLDPIKMTFGMWTRLGPRNHALDGCAHWRHLTDTFCYVKLLWPCCYYCYHYLFQWGEDKRFFVGKETDWAKGKGAILLTGVYASCSSAFLRPLSPQRVCHVWLVWLLSQPTSTAPGCYSILIALKVGSELACGKTVCPWWSSISILTELDCQSLCWCNQRSYQ